MENSTINTVLGDFKLDKVESYNYYTTALACAMPLLPNFLRVVVIVLLLGGVAAGIISKSTLVKPDYKLLILGSFLYLSYVCSLIYTEDLDIGLKKLETGASLIIFPVIFSFFPSKTMQKIRWNLDFFLKIYIGAVSLSFVGSFLYFFGHYKMTLFQHYPTVIDRFLGPYDIHPIYMSMHGAVAIIFLLYLMSKKGKGIGWFLLYAFNAILLACFMLILIKKGPIISLVVAAIYFVMFLKSKKLFLILGAVCVLFASVIIFQPTVNAKFSELLEIGSATNKKLTSTNIRLIIYDCSKKAIPEAGFFGFGVGDAKGVLLECYDNTSQTLADSEFNSHNQYLSILLRTGILGLIGFIIFIFTICIESHRNNGFLAITVMLFYLLVMFSENILERENGVIYFCFWTLLLYKAFKVRPELIENNPNA